jgi:hypothetical protein
LGAGAFPLIAIRPLAMSGRDEHHGFFDLYVLRLDGNRAYKRAVAIANLVGTWKSDFDFEMFDVKWDGTVKKLCLVFQSGTKVRDLFAMKQYGP